MLINGYYRNMFTDDDVQKLIGAMKPVFATKEDVSTLATKEDLEIFPTAIMIKNSFDHMDERFDELKDSFVSHEEYKKLVDRVKRLEELIGINR